MDGKIQKQDGKPLHPAVYVLMTAVILIAAPFIKLGMGIVPSLALIAVCSIPMGILLYRHPCLPLALIIPLYGLSLLYGTNPIRGLLCFTVLTIAAPIAYALRGKKQASDGLLQALVMSALCYLAIWCAVIYKEYGSLSYDNVRLYYSSLFEAGETLSSYTITYGGEETNLFPAELVEAGISLMVKIIPGLFMAALGAVTYICRAVIQSAAIRIGGDDAVPLQSRVYIPSVISAVLFMLCALLSILLLSWESVAGAVCLNLFIMLSPVFFLLGVRGMILRFRIPGRGRYTVIIIAILAVLLFIQPLLPVIYIALSGACDRIMAAVRNRSEKAGM